MIPRLRLARIATIDRIHLAWLLSTELPTIDTTEGTLSVQPSNAPNAITGLKSGLTRKGRSNSHSLSSGLAPSGSRNTDNTDAVRAVALSLSSSKVGNSPGDGGGFETRMVTRFRSYRELKYRTGFDVIVTLALPL
jgi:hypothetical protein